MTFRQASEELLAKLINIYEQREAAAITDLVMENITGSGKIDRIINKNILLSPPAIDMLNKYTSELLNHTPVQYVLHEAWFAGMKFYVDERVLIPRPETEELVDWAIAEIKNKQAVLLDVGTGSGCIPITLKKKLPQLNIIACDISEGALEVANQNATAHEVDIKLLQVDFLNTNDRNTLPPFDYIISNPPYIPLHDKFSLDKHVVDHEPHLALFVDNKKPLIFYEAIADFASEKILAKGKIFAEMHEAFAADINQLFLSKGFTDIEIRKDIYGKNRLIKATMLL